MRWRSSTRTTACSSPSNSTRGAAYCTAECRVEVLDGCGHFMHRERPDDVNRLILDFIGAPVGARAGARGR
jgi:pimeloyl-ACP methyl ester carboxylesterase